MKQLVEDINERLVKGLIPATHLMSRFKYIANNITRRSFFADPRYYPFYYYFGREYQPKAVLDMSLAGGLALGCVLLGSEITERALGFQKKTDVFYSSRMAKHNIRNIFKNRFEIHVGSLNDVAFQNQLTTTNWDAIIINEELDYDDYLGYLRFLWPHLDDKGVVIMDYINYHKSAERAYYDFCKTSNREPLLVKSKYGIGIVEK